jgi:hypothetical protein
MKKTKPIFFFFLFLTVLRLQGQQIIESRRLAAARPIFSKDESTFDLPEPKLTPLITSFDVMFRPEDFDAGNYVAPRISGSYSKKIGKGDKALQFNYQFNLQLQSPQTTQDSTAMLSRLLSSGAVGSLSGSLNASYSSKDNTSGIILAVYPTLSWQSSQLLKDSNPNDFQYYSTRASLTLWTGPIIGVFQASYSNTFGNPPSFINDSLDKKWVYNALIGVSIAQNYYLQIKFLTTPIKVPEGVEKSNQEKFEISVVRTLTF